MDKTLHTLFAVACMYMMQTGMVCSLFAQGTGEQIVDSMKVEELYGRACESYGKGFYGEALNTLGEAMQMASQRNTGRQEAKIMELIGDIYLNEGKAEKAIPYFIRVASVRSFLGDSAGLYDVYRKTGDAYSKAEVHEKALEYYQRSERLTDENDHDELLLITSRMGRASLLSGKTDLAREYFMLYEKLLLEQDLSPVPAWLYMVNTCRIMGDYEECMEYSERLLENYMEEENDSSLAILHNNMGFYLTELGRFGEALDHYSLALTYAEKADFPAGKLSVMMANMGVCRQNMNETEEAKNLFNRARARLKKEGYPAERSRIENIQALIYLRENDLYNAGFFCREAISSAEEAKDSKRLADVYLTYSRVLRAGNDPVNALKYYESYLAVRDSLQLEDKMNQQQLKERVARLEREESDLLLRLKEEKVNELTINRLSLQLEREEQASQLLMKENDLQLLEQERLRQSMVITEQQHKVEQQERQTRLLEQEQRIANMALEQEQRKQKEAEQEIRLLEQKQELDRLSMEKQKAQRKLLFGVVALMILIVILVTGSLVLTRKKNLLLGRQKREIEEKNRDLEFKNEEISAQRDEIEAQRDEIEAQRNLLFDQKEAIEIYNVEITKSIEYAKRIQSSTLSDLSPLQEAVSDYFLLFRPRDIVSGDFYWTAAVEGITVLVVADCTGHGVPGAFMSMLGMSALKEIVQKEYVTHPGVILRRMRKEIIRSLGQKGVPGEQQDGMDMSLIEINREEKRIRYAGAFNSLYLVRKSHFDPPDIQGIRVMNGTSSGEQVLYEIPADRMPISYFERMDKFTTHTFSIEEGDQVYLFTDGYPDQFGGELGKKFKYKPFKQLILEHAHLSMEAQNRVMSDTLDKWSGSYDQVDDICMIGVKF